jgi:hypothetical protein
MTETIFSQMIGVMVLERNSSLHKPTLIVIEDILKVLIVGKENLVLDSDHQYIASELASSKTSMLELIRKLVDRNRNDINLGLYSMVYAEILKYPNDIEQSRD